MKTPAISIATALLCVFAADASGQDADSTQGRHFFVGADLGQAHLNRRWSDLEVFGKGGNATAWKLRFGYRFSRHFALEAALADFGSYDGAELVAYPADSPLGGVAPGEFTTRAKTMGINAVGIWPLGEHFFLTAQAGLARREFKTTYAPWLQDSPGFRANDGDLGLVTGAGVGFNLGESLDLTVEWLKTDNLEGDMEYRPNHADPSMVTMGLRYKL